MSYDGVVAGLSSFSSSDFSVIALNLWVNFSIPFLFQLIANLPTSYHFTKNSSLDFTLFPYIHKLLHLSAAFNKQNILNLDSHKTNLFCFFSSLLNCSFTCCILDFWLYSFSSCTHMYIHCLLNLRYIHCCYISPPEY